MPKRNALAPPSRNALRPDPMQQLLKQSAETPQYGELVDYLSARRAMPPIQFFHERDRRVPLRSNAPSDGWTSGMFISPGIMNGYQFVPQTGQVLVSQGVNPSTVVHELTHAADSQLINQYYNILRKNRGAFTQLTPLERQFKDAYEKLYSAPNKFFEPKNIERDQRRIMAKKLGEDWAEAKSNYRSTSRELSAFGMGNVTQPKRELDAPQHLDPTMATEFSVLLDLANRLQRQQPPQGR